VDHSRAARVLVVVEPALLGYLLTEILNAGGQDEVVHVSGGLGEVPALDRPFSVALVSEPPVDRRIAEVVIVLPAPGSGVAEVRTVTGSERVDVSGPSGVLDLLDRFCPSARPRARSLPSPPGRHGARSVKENRLPTPPGASSTQI
jgi:hypothetical protein